MKEEKSVKGNPYAVISQIGPSSPSIRRHIKLFLLNESEHETFEVNPVFSSDKVR